MAQVPVIVDGRFKLFERYALKNLYRRIPLIYELPADCLKLLLKPTYKHPCTWIQYIWLDF
jgi:hypothetical protein